MSSDLEHKENGTNEQNKRVTVNIHDSGSNDAKIISSGLKDDDNSGIASDDIKKETGVQVDIRGSENSILPMQNISTIQDNSTTSIEEMAPVNGFKYNKNKFQHSLSTVLHGGKLLPVYPLKQDITLKQSLVLAYQTLGVIYGDLGTSPLYVFPTINMSDPVEGDYLGILSVLFWTLTLIGLVKYVCIVLEADDHGEGGTFALYSLICQHLNIDLMKGDEISRLKSDEQLSHFRKNGLVHSQTKRVLENNLVAKRLLLFIVMLGTCMLIGDGILTPAISVLSAISGIRQAASSVSQTIVVMISAVVLIAVFLIQRFGTSKVSSLFSPIMAVWLLTIAAVGAYNIIHHYPSIFKAFSPHYAVTLFSRNGKRGWTMLGGIVLCITGVEAMFADLGHFSKKSIQVSFCAIVYPCLILTYSGQSAYLIKHPEDHRDAFYKSIPEPVFWPILIIATLAAIVASQGLISATFSIIKQSVSLHYFPRVKVVHTSRDKEGQIYSPEVNYILMVLCLAVVIGFHNATTIGNAFGVAVILVMLITTILTALVMLTIWNTHWLFVLLFISLIGLVECLYFSAVLVKIPQGGWLPFAVSAILVTIMLSWNHGRRKKYEYEMRNRISVERLGLLLSDVGNQRVPGLCFFYSDLLQGVPPIIPHYVRNVRCLHQMLILTTIRYIPVKTVLPSERFLVGHLQHKGVYRCIAQYGYMDSMDVEEDEFVDKVVQTLKEYMQYKMICELNSSCSEQDPSPSHSEIPEELECKINPSHQFTPTDILELESAKEDGAVYVVGKTVLRTSKKTPWHEKALTTVYDALQSNSRSIISAWRIPHSSFLEVGMVAEI